MKSLDGQFIFGFSGFRRVEGTELSHQSKRLFIFYERIVIIIYYLLIIYYWRQTQLNIFYLRVNFCGFSNKILRS
jgi:hypothetical protein